MPLFLIVIVGIVFVLIGVVRTADIRLQQMAKNEARAIFQDSTARGGTFSHNDLDHLPAPVQIYLKRCIPDGHPTINTVWLKQSGTMSQNGGKSWFPFTAEQYFTTEPFGFVWLAKLRMLPLVWVAARDKYIKGRGNMLIKPESILTIADATGPELDQGALARFMAEGMWFPTIFTSDQLKWQAIDDLHAKVTICDHDAEFTMTLTFNEAGDLVQVEGLRCREDVNVLIPWGGTVREYSSFDGVRIPSKIEVYWQPDDSYEPYWRGTITEVEYNQTR